MKNNHILFAIKRFLILLVLPFFISCNKDDTPLVVIEEITFLDLTTPQLSAKLNNSSLLWLGGFAEGYSVTSGASFLNESPNIRKLYFTLDQNNGNNQFSISTPIYDFSNETEFQNVFGLGKKSLGNSNQDFKLFLRHNGITFQFCHQEQNLCLKIVKTEEMYVEHAERDQLKGWFKVDDIDLSICNFSQGTFLEDGLILAEFFFYKLI